MSNRVALAASAFVLAATTATAQQEVGEAKAVIDRATASGQVDDRALAVGSVVFLGDEVMTDGQGEAQLLFKDGTRMVVGPNSALVIDQFVFRSQSQENSFAVRALGGAFRFISGDAPKDAYLIHTPAATIGVRGTAFDFTADTSETDLLMLDSGPPDGGAVVCAPGAECERANEACEVVTARRGAGVAVVEDGAARDEKLRTRFPLAGSQEHLAEGFRVENEEATACLGLILASSGAGAASAPVAGASLVGVAVPLGALGLLGGAAGLLAGDDGSDGTPGTPSTPSTPGSQ